MPLFPRVWVGALCLLVTAMGVAWWARATVPRRAPTGLSAAAMLGERIFNDVTLSASGRLACATCHVPEHAHAAGDRLAAQVGGSGMSTMGFRNTPSLRYLDHNTGFFFDRGDGEATPTGGFSWDGRAPDLAAQVAGPLFGPHEMAIDGPTDLQRRLRVAAYADEFRSVFGADALDQSTLALDHLGAALMAFQKEDSRFHPYDSKYDLYLAGKLPLSKREKRGLDLFNDERKGNCAACHPSARGPRGEPPLFTDFTYDVLGVPRNPRLTATASAGYFDLGLCGPDRRDLIARKDLCGAFKVPSLRNIAITAPYFHNGYFQTLEDAVAFYARRDTHPEEWYPKDASGNTLKFDDLPVEYQANVNVGEAPYDRKPGEAPALSAEEINDVVEFLNTLTDGYRR